MYQVSLLSALERTEQVGDKQCQTVVRCSLQKHPLWAALAVLVAMF